MDIAELLKSEEVRRHLRTATSTVGTMVYNELYFYIWLICIYNIFLLLIVIINLYLFIHFVCGMRGGSLTSNVYCYSP